MCGTLRDTHTYIEDKTLQHCCFLFLLNDSSMFCCRLPSETRKTHQNHGQIALWAIKS